MTFSPETSIGGARAGDGSLVPGMDEIERLLASVGCTGSVCVEDVDGAGEVAIAPGEPMVAASVFKVLVAVEAERQFAAGRVDPSRRVLLRARHRTPGPAGFSLYQDDVEVSVRDLLVPMLTISDNVATDELLALLGPDSCNATAALLGMSGTFIVSNLQDTLDSIAQAAGFRRWAELAAHSRDAPPRQAEAEEAAISASPALTAATATRTTARDMCRLLRTIWSDRACPADGCHTIRTLMYQQLTRDRLAAAFPPPARVAAKSGGLVGLIRNEVGVIDYPDGRRYVAAVFTRRKDSSASPAQINAAIGTIAATAVNHLTARR